MGAGVSNRRKLNLAKLARVMGADLQRTYGGNVTHEELAEAHRAAITRNVRAIVDRPGRIPQRLLDDLAAIADAHAVDEKRITVPLTDDSGHPLRHDGTQLPPSPKAAARRAARVRGDVP